MGPMGFDPSKLGFDLSARTNVMAEPLSKVPSPPKDSFDDYLHRPFLFCRELGLDTTLEKLKKRPRYGNTVIGIGSGFTVLDLSAVRGVGAAGWQPSIEHIVIVDRGKRIQELWNVMIRLISSSGNRQFFMQMLSLTLSDQAVHNQWYKGSPTSPHSDANETLEEFSRIVLTNPGAQAAASQKKGQQPANFMAQRMKAMEAGALKSTAPQQVAKGLAVQQAMAQAPTAPNFLSWMSSDENFQRIKKATITFVRIDLFNVEAVTKLRAILNQQKAVIDTVYLSNVEEFTSTVKPSETAMSTQEAFKKAVKVLTDETQAVLVTSKREAHLTQVNLGGTIISRHLPRQQMVACAPKFDAYYKRLVACFEGYNPSILNLIAEYTCGVKKSVNAAQK